MSGGVVLGAGVTGLAAGIATGVPVFEAVEAPGGICSSYYVRPGEKRRLAERPADGEAYRFEIGGGHWIFGGDPTVLEYMRRLVPMRRYLRRSSVFFPETGRRVPYPLQNHLRFLDPEVAARALPEMAQPCRPTRTMQEWLLESFGPTLCDLFFMPFHELYTAGSHERIAPQDAYKSPVDLGLVVRGAMGDTPAVGYNVGYVYPVDGLDALARRMASGSDVRYGKRAARIDVRRREVQFEDGSGTRYDTLISTLPLNRALEMANVEVDAEADPFTSVLCLNVGAGRGARCPEDHWIYVPRSTSGFHRVGFYDNVDTDFLPASARERHDRVSLYIERAYPGGERPDDGKVAAYADAVIRELQAWEFIDRTVDVVDPTWIDVAYTWSWPGSRWPRVGAEALAEHGVFSVGRYGRWTFQGIAESVREGFAAGMALRGV